MPRSEDLRGERNIIVQVATGTRKIAAPRTAFRRTALTIAAIGAREHRHLTLEAGQHDFRRIAFNAALIGPFPRLELTLDVDLWARPGTTESA